MVKYFLKKKQIIDIVKNNDAVFDFGTCANYVGDDWVGKAELALHRKFSESYKWFLKTFRGGAIYGDEIFSIYGQPFESIVGFDIVSTHFRNLKNGFSDQLLEVYRTDEDAFFFDYSRFHENECPIIRIESGYDPEDYAASFYDFLLKHFAELKLTSCS